MGATSRKTMGATGTQINMHKNNTMGSPQRVRENQLEQEWESLGTLPLDMHMDMLLSLTIYRCKMSFSCPILLQPFRIFYAHQGTLALDMEMDMDMLSSQTV
jgi:hypothetical protein